MVRPIPSISWAVGRPTCCGSRRRSRTCKRVLQEKVNALAMRVGQMNANVIRLDALGKRLTRMANLR